MAAGGCNCSRQSAFTHRRPGTRIAPARAARRGPAVVMAMSAPPKPNQTKAAVCIGEALFDCLADQVGVPREAVTSWTPYPGGAPANVATGLSRLGARSVFVGALGDDDLGDRFLALLRERGVDVAQVQRPAGRPTRDVLVTRSAAGDRTFAGFGKAESGAYADCFLDPGRVREAPFEDAAVLVTGTLGLACEPTAAAVRAAVAAAKAAGCAVVIDVNWRPVFWGDAAAARDTILAFLPAADVLKVTDEEAAWLFGLPAAEALAHPEEVLAHAPSARGVLVSAGEKGSSYAFRAPGGKMEVSGEVPVLGVDVVDTTGAGDAYLAGFTFYLLLAGSLEALVADPGKLRRAVAFATACGALTCTRPGAIDAQPTAAEAEALLAQSGLNE